MGSQRVGHDWTPKRTTERFTCHPPYFINKCPVILRGKLTFFLFFFCCSFLLVGGQPFHNIAVVFVILWHESSMKLHVFPIPIPPPTSLSTRSLWVFPVHQARALVSCIQPGLVICFTIDNVHAVLSKHPTLAFSHRVQKSVLYICVSFSVLHIVLSLPSF